MKIKPYYSSDKKSVAVLVSCGFGAGWSTWAYDDALAYDQKIVELFLHRNEFSSLEEIREKIASFGYEEPFMGGFNQLEIQWVPLNTYWRIKEYDGAETIEFLDMSKWNMFVGEGEDD